MMRIGFWMILDDFGFMAFTNILRPIHEHQRSCCSHLGSAHIFHGCSMVFPHIQLRYPRPGQEKGTWCGLDFIEADERFFEVPAIDWLI